jgi:hypothetical protein
MDTNKFLAKLEDVLEMTEKLQESGGVNIVPVRKLCEDNRAWIMVVNVNDIPFVLEKFCDTNMFAHQAFARCHYLETPLRHFLITCHPEAVQDCVTNYVLNRTASAITAFSKEYRKVAQETPQAHPLKNCDVRNANGYR